jgi:hypothetical protein
MIAGSNTQGYHWSTNVGGNKYALFYKVYMTTPTTVSCYQGDPSGGGVLIGSTTYNMPILPGGNKTVSFNWSAEAGSYDIYWTVDRNNSIPESSETNNIAYKNITVLLLSPEVSAQDSHTGIGVCDPVSFTFSKDMNSASVLGAVSARAVKNNRSEDVSEAVSGTAAYSNKVLTYAASWKKGYTYEVTISTAAKDIYSNPMLSAKTWRFSTVLDYNADNIYIGAESTKVTVEAGTVDGDYYIVIDTNPSGTHSLDAKICEANSKIRRVKGAFFAPLNSTMKRFTMYRADSEYPGSFNKDVNVLIPYAETSAGMVKDSGGFNVKESTLRMYWLDEDKSLWVKLPSSSVDTDNNTVSVDINHFSVFAIFGGSDTDLSNAYAYPVPWKPYDGRAETGSLSEGITFTNLGSEASIRIYTLSGELVKTLDYSYSGGNEELNWDCTNRDGKVIASGTYIYYIKNSKEHKTGKIIVIK